MTRRMFAAAALAAALVAGCNAIFDIRAGAPRTGCGDLFIIDDFEDGDGDICDGETSAKRRGSWYTLGDGSGTVSPESGKPFVPTRIDGPSGREGSYYAGRMTGAGFDTWGARLGLNLNVMGLGAQSYNASTIGGIAFWLKSNAPISVELPIPATIPTNEGAGRCADAAGDYNCGNHFQFSIFAPDPESWVEYYVPFSALTQSSRQSSNGTTVFGSASFNPGELVGVQFLASQPSFDVWVDDLRFYNCTGPGCVPKCTDPTRPKPCPATTTGHVAAGCWPDGADCATVPVIANGFYGVWGSAPRDLWLVGGSVYDPGGTVVRWNGSAWSAALKATPAILTGIWGSGPGDVWAVSDQGTIFHTTGAGWTTATVETTRSLQGVWGSGPADIWAVGLGGTIAHWDGGGVWKAVPSGTTQSFLAVAGTGANDVWAVGLSETTGAGVIVHWDGVVWRAVSGGGAGTWLGVWAAAPNDAWAVGAVSAGGNVVGAALRWDGAQWSAVPTGSLPPTAVLWGVWGSGPSDVWAVGDGGTALHWDGAAWSTVPTGTKQHLVRIWGSGRSDVWAVGDVGTIVHWNGSAWEVVPPGAITVDTR